MTINYKIDSFTRVRQVDTLTSILNAVKGINVEVKHEAIRDRTLILTLPEETTNEEILSIGSLIGTTLAVH